MNGLRRGVILMLLLVSALGMAQERLLTEAERALDYGQYVEAIELLIRARRAGSPEASSRLQELEAAMSLRPAASWLDDGGQQIEGRLVDFEAAEGLDPAVLATINLGAGQAVVTDLPVAFDAVTGEAQLITPVTTSDYGLANSRIVSVTDPYAPLVVRARVIFAVDGSSYVFRSLSRDFAYQPLSRQAALLVLVVDGQQVRYQDRDTDRLAAALESEGLTFVAPGRLPDPALLLGSADGARENGRESTRATAAESVLVLVIAEVLEASQVTLGDRVFDIWKADVATSYRVLRTEDRRLLARVPGPRESGQGASRAQAIAGAIDRAITRLETEIEGSPSDYAW